MSLRLFKNSHGWCSALRRPWKKKEMWNPTAGKIVLRNLLYQKRSCRDQTQEHSCQPTSAPTPRTFRAWHAVPPGPLKPMPNCMTAVPTSASLAPARSLGIGCAITNPAAPACCCTPSTVASAARCLTVTPHPEFTSFYIPLTSSACSCCAGSACLCSLLRRGVARGPPVCVFTLRRAACPCWHLRTRCSSSLPRSRRPWLELACAAPAIGAWSRSRARAAPLPLRAAASSAWAVAARWSALLTLRVAAGIRRLPDTRGRCSWGCLPAPTQHSATCPCAHTD